MAFIGATASWIAAIMAACAFGAGVAGTTREAHIRRWGERALAASAVSAAIAACALVQLLLAGDLSVTYVARTITTNLPAGYRAVAIWQLPAGSVLPTAALAALAGGITASRVRDALAVAAVGAVVLALMATSLAASPFAVLPWLPGDGLGLDPGLQHPRSVASQLALAVAVAVSVAGTACAAAGAGTNAGSAAPSTADLRVLPNEALERLLAAAVIVLLAFAMWSGGQGLYATGKAPTSSALAAFSGVLVAPMVGVGLALLTGGAGTPRLAIWLGVIVLLARAQFAGVRGDAGSWALQGAAVGSLAVALLGAVASAARARREALASRAGGIDEASGRLVAAPSPWPARVGRASYLLALACAVIAAVGERAGVTIERTVASGGRVEVPRRFGSPVMFVHQGISQFEDENAHVAALALEPVVDGRARPLLSPDRREYVDSRDEILAAPLARPAVARFLFEEIRIVVEAFGADQRARLRIAVVPCASLWGVSVLFVTVALLARLVTVGGRKAVAVPASSSLDSNVTMTS